MKIHGKYSEAYAISKKNTILLNRFKIDLAQNTNATTPIHHTAGFPKAAILVDMPSYDCLE